MTTKTGKYSAPGIKAPKQIKNGNRGPNRGGINQKLGAHSETGSRKPFVKSRDDSDGRQKFGVVRVPGAMLGAAKLPKR